MSFRQTCKRLKRFSTRKQVEAHVEEQRKAKIAEDEMWKTQIIQKDQISGLIQQLAEEEEESEEEET